MLLPGSPRSCTPSSPGGDLFLFQAQLWEGSCSVGIRRSEPAALLEEMTHILPNFL